MAAAREADIATAHWMPEEFATHCNHPGCAVVFGSIERKVHCRRCGIIYCSAHVSKTRLLSRDAQPDQEGAPHRVCDACAFWRADGQAVARGASRDHTSAFASMRETRFKRQADEASKVHRRLRRLAMGPGEPSARVTAAGLASSSPPPGSSTASSVAAVRLTAGRAPTPHATGESGAGGTVGSLFRTLKRAAFGDSSFEQSVVPWEPAESVAACPTCARAFSLLVRRVHCRLCGRVFCGTCTDYAVPYSSVRVLEPDEETAAAIAVRDGDARTCGECYGLAEWLLREAHFTRALRRGADPERHPYLPHYKALEDEKRRIREILPQYDEAMRLLAARRREPLPDFAATQAHNDFMARQEARATELQRAIVTRFRALEAHAKAAAAAPTDSPEAQAIQRAILMASILYTNEMFAMRRALSALKASRPSP